MRRLLAAAPILALGLAACPCVTPTPADGLFACAVDKDCDSYPGFESYVCDAGVCWAPPGDGGTPLPDAGGDAGCCPLGPNQQQDCRPPADCTPFNQCTDALGGLGYCVPLVEPGGVEHWCFPVGPQSGTSCQALPPEAQTCDVTPTLVSQLCGLDSDCVADKATGGACVQICHAGGPACDNGSRCSVISCSANHDQGEYLYVGICLPLLLPDGGDCPAPLPFSG